jgi:hypothetical protein
MWNSGNQESKLAKDGGELLREKKSALEAREQRGKEAIQGSGGPQFLHYWHVI